MRPILIPTLILSLAALSACDETPAPAKTSPVVETDATTGSESQPSAEPAAPQEVQAPVDPPAQPEATEPESRAEQLADEALARPKLSRVIRKFMLEAEGLEPLMETQAAREFLAEVPELPEIQPRRIFVRQSAVPDGISEAEFQMLSDEIKDQLIAQDIGMTKYYQTIYGSPLAYARPLDIAAGAAGWESFNEKKIFDFGYGQIGQLRLLAQCGADVTGIESSSLISAMYTLPGDTGEITGGSGANGSLRLFQGYWPAGQFARENVGTGYDLIMARNVLRKGPMDLENVDVRPELRVRLRTTHEMFLARTNQALKTGGYAIVYNIGGAGPELWEQFPASDFSCPFTREQWEAAGFELLALNEADDEPARKIGKALFLDRGANGISLETNLYAQYTLARKVRETPIPGVAPGADD